MKQTGHRIAEHVEANLIIANLINLIVEVVISTSSPSNLVLELYSSSNLVPELYSSPNLVLEFQSCARIVFLFQFCAQNCIPLPIFVPKYQCYYFVRNSAVPNGEQV